MNKILIEDFEKHGFEVSIIEHCEDEEILCEIRKNDFFFKVYFDENGEYLKFREFNSPIFADEVTDFKDLLGKLADKIGHASIVYRQRSILARIVYDKLMKEIEENEKERNS